MHFFQCGLLWLRGGFGPDLDPTWHFFIIFYFFVHFSTYLSVFVVVFSSKLINFGENRKGVHCKNFQILIILVIFSFFFSFYLSVFIQSFWSNLIKIFKIWSLFILTKILDGSILQLWRFVDSCPRGTWSSKTARIDVVLFLCLKK